MAKDLCPGCFCLETGNEWFERPPLFAGEIVGRLELVVDPALKADPDVVPIVPLNVRACLAERAALLDAAIAPDNEMVADVGPALLLVPGTDLFHACNLTRARG